MSHVNFKKWQWTLSLFLQCPCQFFNSLMLLDKFKEMSVAFFLLSISSMSHVDFMKFRVALSNVRVKGS